MACPPEIPEASEDEALAHGAVAAEAVAEAYEVANVILEYGSGDHTLLASKMSGKVILSVEGDRARAQELGEKLMALSPPSMPAIHVVNFDAFGASSSKPAESSLQEYMDYLFSPWDFPGFPGPDVVHISGKFRTASFLATCIRCKKPTTVLFDGYMDGADRRVLEKYFKPIRIVGRMAEFAVTPVDVSSEILTDTLSLYVRALSSASEARDGRDPEGLIAKIARLKRHPIVLSLLDPLEHAPVPVRRENAGRFKKWLPKLSTKRRQVVPYALPEDIENLSVDLRAVYSDQLGPQSGRVPEESGPGGPQGVSDDFVLYRIIGNDLEPRHEAGQSIRNLEFILEHEGELKDCKKAWVLNRIYDIKAERKLIRLLEDHNQSYWRIPFSFQEYSSVPLDYSPFNGKSFFDSWAFDKMEDAEKLRATTQTCRLKNSYVMNNNGARNFALDTGRKQAKWVLPWDGNCFVTPQAWNEIRDEVIRNNGMKYFVVPMARINDNSVLLSVSATVEAEEEPQVIFRHDFAERFDPAHPYGRRPKVELLVRLGVSGPWDRWGSDPWDIPLSRRTDEANFVGKAGWVARLSSGKSHLETGNSEVSRLRTDARSKSILMTLQKLDDEVLRRRADWYCAAKDNSSREE